MAGLSRFSSIMVLAFGVLPSAVFAATTSPDQTPVPSASSVHPKLAARQNAFAHLVGSSLFASTDKDEDPRQGAALVRSISAQRDEVVHVKGSRFTDAPLPDDDLTDPSSAAPPEAHVEAGMFKQDGRPDDATTGSRASQSRNGHGTSGVVSLDMPMP